MAGFDLDALINNPTFQTGLGVMGAANPRSGLMDAYKVLNSSTMQQAKLKEEASQREMEKRRMGIMEQQANLYGRQVTGQETANAIKQRELELATQKQQGMQQLMPVLIESISKRFAPKGQTQPQGEMIQLPGQQQPVPMPSAPQGFFRDKLLPIEAGIDEKTGVFRVSPKGAIGPAQVMPQTAPEAAALAGLPFDDQRYRTDKDYNIALGQAYFDKQLQTYGNVPQAAAAYNAGPKAVADAIDRAKKFGNPNAWLSFMPKETQAYVQKSTGYSGGGIPQQLTAQGLVQQHEAEMEAYKMQKAQIGLMQFASGDHEKGLAAINDALKPDLEGSKLLLQEQGIRNDERRTNIAAQAEQRQQAQETRIADAATKERDEKRADAQLTVQQYDDQMQTAHDLANRLRNHPGLKYITGRFAGSLPAALVPTSEGLEALTLLEQLKGITFIQGTLAIRQASPTGAGVGNQSNQEGTKLESSVARLNRIQDTESIKKALEEFEQLTQRARGNVRGAYEKGWGQKLDLPDITNSPRQQSGKVRVQVVAPDGRRATVPEDQLDEALKQGFKKVQ
jgi:hypothetical protein